MQTTPTFGVDKLEHLAGGAAIAAAADAAVAWLAPAWAAGWGRWAGLAGAVAAGIAKEVRDHQDPRHHDCDLWDAVATAAGGAGAVLAEAPLAHLAGAMVTLGVAAGEGGGGVMVDLRW